jgi:hypothetical protein
LVCNRYTLSQRSLEFGDRAGDEIGVDQEWADVSSAGKGHYLRAATSELVNDLQELGYLERQPDPATDAPS